MCQFKWVRLKQRTTWAEDPVSMQRQCRTQAPLSSRKLSDSLFNNHFFTFFLSCFFLDLPTRCLVVRRLFNSWEPLARSRVSTLCSGSYTTTTPASWIYGATRFTISLGLMKEVWRAAATNLLVIVLVRLVVLLIGNTLRFAYALCLWFGWYRNDASMLLSSRDS